MHQIEAVIYLCCSFVCRHYLSQEVDSFPRVTSLRKTVSFEKQNEIMTKDKYLGIFLRRMETIVFIILQIFLATHTLFKIGEYHLDTPHF